jgi:hypothetical protein
MGSLQALSGQRRSSIVISNCVRAMLGEAAGSERLIHGHPKDPPSEGTARRDRIDQSSGGAQPSRLLKKWAFSECGGGLDGF